MRPAFSVVFLTTLIGAGQGHFVALYAAEAGAVLGLVEAPPATRFFVVGSAFALALAVLGLFASFFHLGRPERAWRSAAMWRTSWLSREVIALPAFMVSVAAYGAAHHFGWGHTAVLGALALGACLALFFCTAMIYACIKFLQEWASPFTIANFFLMGCASGFTLAVPLAAALAPPLGWPYAIAAVVLTLAALGTRLASLARNARIRPKSSLQSAIGVRHSQIKQQTQGFMGASFNTIEFFHGASAEDMRAVRNAFLQLAFVLPILLTVGGMKAGSVAVLAAAFAVQYAGLVVERWFFLAQSNHPQNLYYQSVA
ncbi:MAG: dimethyl sulfoxide reductase anchor subunit [Pseudomonadota bacterium]|nr:dimethyl sulfoxide reductase anchor subunit [Pseudomonadota bacterium]